MTIPSQSGHCGLIDLLVVNIAVDDSFQPQQILVNRPAFLPLLDYHYSYLVAHPRTELVSEIGGHATYVVVVDPSAYELVQPREYY